MQPIDTFYNLMRFDPVNLPDYRPRADAFEEDGQDQRAAFIRRQGALVDMHPGQEDFQLTKNLERHLLTLNGVEWANDDLVRAQIILDNLSPEKREALGGFELSNLNPAWLTFSSGVADIYLLTAQYEQARTEAEQTVAKEQLLGLQAMHALLRQYETAPQRDRTPREIARGIVEPVAEHFATRSLNHIARMVNQRLPADMGEEYLVQDLSDAIIRRAVQQTGLMVKTVIAAGGDCAATLEGENHATLLQFLIRHEEFRNEANIKQALHNGADPNVLSDDEPGRTALDEFSTLELRRAHGREQFDNVYRIQEMMVQAGAKTGLELFEAQWKSQGNVLG